MSDDHGSNAGWDHSRWDQAGPNGGGSESAGPDGAGSDSAGSGGAGWDKSAWAEASRESLEQDAAAARPVSRGQGQRKSVRPSQDRRQSRPRQAAPGADMLSDFQRWLLRSSAKSMRREITGQVRRTFGGGRPDRGDVWDTATTEIPPEVGESPECQWCPICRAARRMRDSGPGLGDHLSTAGDMVSAAVSEALKSVDTVLSRTTGAGGRPAPRDTWAPGSEGWDAARDSWAAAHGARVAGHDAGGQPAEGGHGDQPAEGGHGDQPAVGGQQNGAAVRGQQNGAAEGGQQDQPAQGRHDDSGQQTEGPDEPDDRG